MEKEHKSFRITPSRLIDKKWYRYDKMSRKELGKNALIFLFLGAAFSMPVFRLLGLLAIPFSIYGFFCGIGWLYKVIRRQ
ncbi:MAG: hypothetical protein A3A29_00780 [Candidatus Ryanbacteria bacterium RIFCSPLOWO2_01_FULL_47_79]|uniref:Uncharacterized protein n=1 Tax=Candidatus Yanofskybacteria bacterium RIFCSPLOWO2_02_FULL_45_10 TaxID=1802706 RepID=A0A1F8H3J4_9BACT|nr:MAG: hypothetical protein A3I32_00380 [Candidatus Yanofskybacteria bacterium RIFCSPLOWO2_02_FULL_45_10]OGZ52283.1 MAG: hypothetical protein A3A29_00780 [Candidatus Ryanbacteria bacterium RIFCSPLOWO2_01_FULL_47_79]